LSGPLAEVNGERNAMAVVTGEDYYLFAARMVAENRAHFFREENRTAPAVRDPHVGKGGMQMPDATLERTETVCGLAPVNIIAVQIVRDIFDGAITEGKTRRRAYVSGDEPGAEDNAIRFEQASPQIRKVDGVKRAARGEADGFELRGGQRSSGQGKGELRRGSGAQAG